MFSHKMYFRLTLFNVCTLILICLAASLAAARLRLRPESNWPLFSYAGVVGYWKAFEGGLNTWWVFAGVACAVLLRFEFLGGAALALVRAVEYAFVGYVILRGLQLLLLWPW
jgi:hypothetical protein